MATHEAGALHNADNVGPSWLHAPADVNELVDRLWPHNVQRNDHGVLEVAGLDVNVLAAQCGTPLFVIDEMDFKARAQAFVTEFRRAFVDVVEQVDVYYAAKAFVCTEVARWVKDLGLGLDTASRGELAIALRADVPREQITLHGNNKSDDDIQRALLAGVGCIVVDHQDEIAQVGKLATELGVTANVLIRVTVGVEAHTHSYIATAHEDQKFGLSLATGAAQRAAVAAASTDGVDLLGLHCHIGSQIFDTAGFEIAVGRMVGLVAALASDGISINTLNVGGGFGVAYTTTHQPMPTGDLADHMAQVVRQALQQHSVSIPRLVIEPGRAISAPSTFTLYRVGVVKDVTLPGGHIRRYVSVDGGMSDNIRPALYGAAYSATLASRKSAAPPVLSRVVGKHCESGDIVVPDEFLPADIAPGDLVAVPVTGGYGRSMASNYNLVARPGVVAVRDGSARFVVRHETEADVLATDLG